MRRHDSIAADRIGEHLAARRTDGGRGDVHGEAGRTLTDTADAPDPAPMSDVDDPARPAPTRPARRRLQPSARRRRRSSLSFGHIILIASGVAGFAGTLLVLGGDGTRQQIAVASQDLASGTQLTDQNVTFRSIEIDPAIGATMASPDDLDATQVVLDRPVEAGAPILLSSVRPADASDGRSRLSVPIPVERAVGGDLAVGSRVHLIGVLREASTTFASFVAVDVEVTDVLEREGEAGLLNGSAGDRYFVTVALEPDDLLSVTTVLGAGTIEVAEAPVGGGLPDITRSAVATEAGVVVVPRQTLVNAIESEGRSVPGTDAAPRQEADDE